MHSLLKLSLLSDFVAGDYFTTVIIPAMSTNMMRKARLMAILAFHHIGRGEFPVCPAPATSCSRMSSFGEWHLLVSSDRVKLLLRKVYETFPAIINFIRMAATTDLIPIDTARGAQPFAVVMA